MLLLLFAGTKVSSAPVTTLKVTKCCFQYIQPHGKAFQKNAFQNCGLGVGWSDAIGKRRIPRKDLERLLELQKNNTFGRRWFAEFEAAQDKYAADNERAELAEMAREARKAAAFIDGDDRPRLGGLLQLAAETRNYELARDVTQQARQITLDAEFVRKSREAYEEIDDERALLALLGAVEPKTDDDDEAILILLH